MSHPEPAALGPLRAGFAKLDISTGAAGAQMVGYASRKDPTVAVHDPLFARSLVLEAGRDRVAICSLDLCHVGEDVVAAARDRIARETGIPRESALVAATHTHSAPADTDPAPWPDGLHAQITESVAQARDRLQPAAVGAGWGMLHGHSLNRRRLEDPIDPAVFVIRVDDAAGQPLGVCYGFGCHPVVLGPDNRHASGDWPAQCSRLLESCLGPAAVAVFAQGASGDVNPLTPRVRELLATGVPVAAEADGARYYAPPHDHRQPHDIGDRRGGTFEEAEQLGHAVAEEALRVRRGVAAQSTARLWTKQLHVAVGHAGADGMANTDPPGGHAPPRVPPGTPLEVMLVGIDGPGILLVCQPGEVFTETGVSLRRDLRHAGVPHAFVVGHANGRRGYLPPRRAFPDGGYEVDWARATRLPDTVQDDIRARVLAAVTPPRGALSQTVTRRSARRRRWR